MRVSHAIVFVSDMQRSVAFYRDVFGMVLRFQSPDWTEFATDGATLALHASDESGTERSDSSHPAGRCRPGIGVTDIDAFHQHMLANKVRCVQAPTEVFGVRIAQYLDPDGLEISVSQDRRSG